eukprot:scaffold1149_cov236-Pinguiococcus_pyrenoidosus.AAC.15
MHAHLAAHSCHVWAWRVWGTAAPLAQRVDARRRYPVSTAHAPGKARTQAKNKDKRRKNTGSRNKPA